MEMVENGIKVYEPYSQAEVIRLYQDVVYRVAFVYCKNAADAEDITQEVFIRYLKSKKSFESEEHLKAWLIRVTINASRSLLRTAWFRKITPLSVHEELPDESADDNNTNSNIETFNAVMALPDKYRSVILLFYFEDYSIKEIANILRRTETAVQTQLQRARAMLKKVLSEVD